MAKTIKLGGRELEVVEATVGLLEDKWWPWSDKMGEALTDAAKLIEPRESVRAVAGVWAEGFHILVGHNPDASVDWIRRALPLSFDAIMALLRAATDAAGISAPGDKPAGEATRP